MSKRFGCDCALTRRKFLSLAGLSCLVGCAGGLSSCGGASSSGAGHSTEQTSTSASDKPVYQGSTDPADYSSQSITLFAFNTVVEIQALCTSEMLGVLDARCQYFERLFSRTVEGSDVWNINNAKGAYVTVAKDTRKILARAIEYGKKTEGRFDVTIGSVTRLWDFDKGVVPDPASVKEALKHVDYRGVRICKDKVSLKNPQAALDLGGIAKGYIADDLIALLKSANCPSAIINLGGNVYTLGNKENGQPFTVGIKSGSFDREEKIVATVKTNTEAVVSSGLYERFFKKDGEVYYHVLDPNTGYPARTDLMSASIACTCATDGDVYATDMLLMGAEASLAWAKGAGREVYLVRKDGGVASTSRRFVSAG